MRLLLALATLLTAALAALLFPSMKFTLLLIPFALLGASLLNGCSSADFERKIRTLPDGHFDSVRFTETGKFTSTTIVGTNVNKTGNAVTADKFTAKHSNPWFPNIELEVSGWALDVSPNTRSKKAPMPAPEQSPALTPNPPP